MALHEAIEQTVTGLGYELVDIERSAGGLLRVTIDLPWSGGATQQEAQSPAEQFVTVEDCEKVTRQLQAVLEVDAVPYKRLEVSSPGIDRPLRKETDLQRFAGEIVDVTLKAPIGGGTEGVDARRKKFRGSLEKAPQGWQIVWSDEVAPAPGRRVGKKQKSAAPLQSLVFGLDEIKEARLAPIVNFKGRKAARSA